MSIFITSLRLLKLVLVGIVVALSLLSISSTTSTIVVVSAFTQSHPFAFTGLTCVNTNNALHKSTSAKPWFVSQSIKQTNFHLSSTKEGIDGEISSSSSNNNDPVFEDVDGIGKLTINTLNDLDLNTLATTAAPASATVTTNSGTASATSTIQEEIIKESTDVFKIDNIITENNSDSNNNNSNHSNNNIIDNTNDETTSSSSSNFNEFNPPNPENIVDILNISDNNDTQTQQLIDPTAVVEGIIGGTALKDLEDNSIEDKNNNININLNNEIIGIDDHNKNDDDRNTNNNNILLNEDEELLMKSYNEYQGIEEVVQEQVQQIVNKEIIEDQEESASVVVEETVDVPNLAKIIKFAIPAVGVWLCSPLLSLIDTSSVGLLSGTAQQAALNPAVAVTDYTAMFSAFMYTATTNLVAGSKGQEKEGSDDDQKLTKKTLIQALQFSGYVGGILGTFLIALGPILLKTIIGNDQIDPKVFSAALRYVRIRALGMPAAVIIGSAQSACIGMQDIKSPMYVLLAAALVNLLGDVIFVPQANAWLGGAAGAAWATVFSQYAALAMFVKWMTSRPKQQTPTVNLTKAILELTGKSDEGKSRRRKFRRALQKLSTGNVNLDGDSSNVAFSTSSSTSTAIDGEGGVSDSETDKRTIQESRRSKLVKKMKGILLKNKAETSTSTKKDVEKEFSVRGFLSGSEKMLFRLPSLEEAKIFWPYVIPVTTTSVGRVSSYISMSHVVSSTLGTLSMAANQVILSVFYCLTPIADSLNLTAQSFVPVIAQKKSSLARAKALRQISNNFVKGGLITSVGMVGAIGCLPFVSKYFTSDPTVIPLVNSIVPALTGFFATHGIVCSLEGVLLGQKDLNFLGRAYASYFFIVPYFMLRVKKMALQGVEGVGLTSLWNVFFCYNVVRAAMWLVRTKMLSDKAMKEVNDDK